LTLHPIVITEFKDKNEISINQVTLPVKEELKT